MLINAYGANITIADKHRRTVLHTAAHNDLDKLVKKLIDAGAVINAIDENGDSPLFDAARAGSLNSAIILVEHGADFNLMNKNNKSALDMANEHGIK